MARLPIFQVKMCKCHCDYRHSIFISPGGWIDVNLSFISNVPGPTRPLTATSASAAHLNIAHASNGTCLINVHCGLWCFLSGGRRRAYACVRTCRQSWQRGRLAALCSDLPAGRAAALYTSTAAAVVAPKTPCTAPCMHARGISVACGLAAALLQPALPPSELLP